MIEYSITPLGGRTFQVKVADGESQSIHKVTVDEGTITSLAWEGSLEELIRRSFDFLLQRERKESILASFELSEISPYFPEYLREIRQN